MASSIQIVSQISYNQTYHIKQNICSAYLYSHLKIRYAFDAHIMRRRGGADDDIVAALNVQI